MLRRANPSLVYILPFQDLAMSLKGRWYNSTGCIPVQTNIITRIAL
jgi:hypothetical protein